MRIPCHAALAIALALVSPAMPSAACSSPPPGQNVPVDELIARTHNIVLAQAVAIEDLSQNQRRYHFATVRIVAGTAPQTFTLDFARDGGGLPGTFDDHRAAEFWRPHTGRVTNDEACDIQADFVVGEHYLVFADWPQHRKGFERIERLDGDDRDRWLAYVEAKIADPARQEPSPEQHPGRWRLSPADPVPPPDPR